MCTVLFIPKDNSVYFASLRDENPFRPKALEPNIYGSDHIQFTAPKDAEAGGTWVGANEFNNVIILLNGGFETHIKHTNYKKSRGLIVLELLQTELPVIDWNLMPMADIEHFTLIVWSDNNLFHLVWDGQQKHKYLLDASIPHIWCSATLYNPAVKEKRRQLFENWTATNPIFSQQSILTFFRTYMDKENGFIMNRNNTLRTLSYSFLEVYKDEQITFDYFDFITHQNTKVSIKIQDTFSSFNTETNSTI